MQDLIVAFIALALTAVLLVVRRLFLGWKKIHRVMRVHILTRADRDVGPGDSGGEDEWPSIIVAGADLYSSQRELTGAERIQTAIIQERNSIVVQDRTRVQRSVLKRSVILVLGLGPILLLGSSAN